VELETDSKKDICHLRFQEAGQRNDIMDVTWVHPKTRWYIPADITFSPYYECKLSVVGHSTPTGFRGVVFNSFQL
jgi:hypothetical protein